MTHKPIFSRLLNYINFAILLPISNRGRPLWISRRTPTAIEQVNARLHEFTDNAPTLFGSNIVYYPINTGPNHWVSFIADTRPKPLSLYLSTR
jgi:hypothetical protein